MVCFTTSLYAAVVATSANAYKKKSRSVYVSFILHLLSPGAIVRPYQKNTKQQRSSSTSTISLPPNIHDESAICLVIMQPVLRVRSGSIPKFVSEPDFRSGHPSSLSLSISRVVLPNPRAGNHVIFVAKCGTLEAQPSRSTNPYAKAPMEHCRLSGACSGCDARLPSTLCVTNEPITVQNKDPALLFAYREQC